MVTVVLPVTTLGAQRDSGTGSNPARYDVGDRVPVAYDPADPEAARVDTFGSLYTAPLIFGGIAVVFLAVGLPMHASWTDSAKGATHRHHASRR